MPDSRDPLDQNALQEAAGPRWTVRLHDAAESTNALAAAAPEAGLVVVADHQTAGRGRLDRVWVTPAGTALTFSAVLEPELPPARWPLLPLMTGLAVARSIGPRAQLKWPNDVLIEDLKVCGILSERPASAPRLAVIGIGVNVDQREDELPVPTAVSLRTAGLPHDRTELFGEVLAQLSAGADRLRSDPAGLVEDYRARCVTLGRRVRVELPTGERLLGVCEELLDDGRIAVRPETGDRVVVGAGDVIHVRPAP